MRLSVVIPAYNNLDKVLRCLNSLQGLQAPFEYHLSQQYTVQDDASPEYDLRALIPTAIASTYRNEVNLGFPGNVNEGVKHSRNPYLPASEFVFILNQDVFAHPDWSHGWEKALIDAFDNPQVAVVGARLLFPNGAIQSAGGLFDARGTPFHRCLGYSDPHYHEVSEPMEVSWCTGGAFAVRRNVWNELGGFDTIYGKGYFEDVQFCVQARQRGYTIMYEPRCTLIHEVGSTGGNGRFGDNARIFKERFVDTGVVKPDTHVVKERFW